MAYLLGKVSVPEFERLVFQNDEKDKTANITGNLYVHIGPILREITTGFLYLFIVTEPGQIGSPIWVPYSGEPFWEEREDRFEFTHIDRHHLVKYRNHWMKVPIKSITEFLKSGNTSDIEICVKFCFGIHIVLQQSERDDRLSVPVSCTKIRGFKPKYHVKEIEMEPNLENAELWGDKGDKSLKNKDPEEAVKAYVKALEFTPGNPRLWEGKGIALYRLERYEEAVKAYDRAIQINTENGMRWGRSTRSYSPKREHEDEERDDAYACQREIEIKTAPLWERKGAAFFQLGRYEEEKWAYHLAKESRRTGWVDSESCCERLFKKAKYLKSTEEAIKAWDDALEFDPGSAELWENKGEVLKHLGRLVDAEKCFSRAVEISSIRSGDQK